MPYTRRHSLQVIAAAAAIPVIGRARAQAAFPSKPIKVIVGFTPGGAVDLVARTVAQAMSTSLGQPIVIENKPGAGTNIAVKSVIDAPPDGYTLMLTANSIAANPALFQPPPFDPEKDIAPVSLVGRVPLVIAANPNAPYTSIASLLQAAKARPKTIAYGTPDVPTIAESGFPGFEASVWYGFIAPAATPKPVIARLHAEVQKALASPEVKERLAAAGGEVLPGPVEQLTSLIQSERVRYARLVREAKIKPD